MTKILDGKILSGKIHEYILSKVKTYSGRAPGLAVIIVGNNPASKAYVARKSKVAKSECGFETFDYPLPEDVTQPELENLIKELNQNEEIDGILLQLPLPKNLDTNKCLDLISAEKDVDGLHPLNQGLLQRNSADLVPCTPTGCLSLIDLAYSDKEASEIKFEELKNIDLSGKTAVVIGRSILVGKPVATMLLNRNATVSIVHSKTKNIQEICANADIIIAAVGVPSLVKKDWVKPGAIVIDVGINKVETGLVGDVDFNDCKDRCLAITPVPGGCGPMTVAMLMRNTLTAYQKKFNLS